MRILGSSGSNSCFLMLHTHLRYARQDRVLEEFVQDPSETHQHSSHILTQTILFYSFNLKKGEGRFCVLLLTFFFSGLLWYCIFWLWPPEKDSWAQAALTLLTQPDLSFPAFSGRWWTFEEAKGNMSTPRGLDTHEGMDFSAQSWKLGISLVF